MVTNSRQERHTSAGDISLQVSKIGSDILAVISGGERPHIGCAVISVPRDSLSGDGSTSCTTSVLSLAGHKDEQICRMVSEALCVRYGATVVCTGGFHKDDITAEEISEVISAVRDMIALKAVIFDLDGVICFTDSYHYLAWKQIADKLGVHFDENINDRLRGIGRLESLDIILENSGIDLDGSEKEAIAAEKNEIYRGLLSKMSPGDVKAEVTETLKSLRDRGYLLAVGSSSKNTKFILERIKLLDFFDAIADGTDISRSKPDPEVFLKAAGKLGVCPSECVVVEDAKSGIKAAKAAGMTALALFGDAKGCGLEDYDLKSFADILEYLT